jgi:hypothetical protein
VLVFVASFAIHMLLGYHRADYGRVASEDAVQDALRTFTIPPGDYMVPCPGRRGPRDPEFAAKHKKGPVLMMTVFPAGEMGMGKQLVMWLLYCVLVGAFTAYVATLALAPGASYPPVFHLVAIVAFMGYGLALWQYSIWYRRKWSTTIRSTIDSLIYGMLTAGVFGWLWPR